MAHFLVAITECHRLAHLNKYIVSLGLDSEPKDMGLALAWHILYYNIAEAVTLY